MMAAVLKHVFNTEWKLDRLVMEFIIRDVIIGVLSRNCTSADFDKNPV